MRIVAGALRGRTIEAPSGEGTRPTTDRVREALFSSLYSLRGGFEGAVVLDAFAGSGALVLEALSRGAQSAVFFERDAKAASVLKRNIEALGLDATHARVVGRDVMQSAPVASVVPFDLVFLDPPYVYEAEDVLGMVAGMRDSGAVAPGAIVVYEHAHASQASVAKAAEGLGFVFERFKKYGKTGVTTLTCGETA